MARLVKACMALLVCHAWNLICAFNLSLRYHVTEEPSGVAFHPGVHSDIIPAFSNFQCATACLMSDCVGFSFQDNDCYLEGIGNASGLYVGGPQLFRQWTENRAFLKQVYVSGLNYPGSPPKRATDNQTCVRWSKTFTDCCYASYRKERKWMVIDLGTTVRVHVVAVGTQRMMETEVRVGQVLITGKNFSSYELLGHCTTEIRKGWMKFSKRGGIVGRYVSIQHIPYFNLFVCDVVVLADD